MARMTSRKDSLASFVWTMGAADMVIGGVGERGSLFAFGLLTVGAGVLVGWLRQRRLDNLPWANRSRGASAFLTQQLRSVGVSALPRNRRRGTSGVRRRAASSYTARPMEPPFRRPSPAPGVVQPGRGAESARVKTDIGSRSGSRSPQAPSSSAPPFQGLPLNLPPAPRPRSRRGRRIY